MMNSSDRLPLARLADLGESAGFHSSPLYSAGHARPDPWQAQQDERRLLEQAAYARGFADGQAKAAADAEDRLEADRTARESLTFALGRIDDELIRQLADRLREVVITLCCETLSPLAVDEAMLLARIDKALEMLRKSGERTLCLNPDDIPLVREQLARDVALVPDPGLERGALRVETADGGVEDSPRTWRAAIEEALKSC